jgi:hypothetical protein
MTKTKNIYLAFLAVLLLPMAANADLIEITAEGGEDGGLLFGGFTIVYDDISGDGLFQIEELLSFSGFTVLFPGFGPVEIARPDILFATPNILGISTFTGIGNFWGVELSLSELGFPLGEPVGYGPGFWTYSARNVSVPEPGTLALLGIGLLGMGAARRRKKA